MKRKFWILDEISTLFRRIRFESGLCAKCINFNAAVLSAKKRKNKDVGFEFVLYYDDTSDKDFNDFIEKTA